MIRISCTVSCLLFCWTWSAHAQIPTDDLQHWIGRLGADSYRTRLLAREKLIERSLSDESAAEQVLEILGRSDDVDLESMLAKREVSNTIREIYRQKRLNRFATDGSHSEAFLSGWTAFAKYAGTGNDARTLYAQILSRYPDFDSAIRQSQPYWTEQMDPKTMVRDDIVIWSMRLARELAFPSGKTSLDRCRLVSTLRDLNAGPLTESHRYAGVTNRLVSHIIDSDTLADRDRLLIGAKYDCSEITSEVCRSVLENVNARPSTIIVALLVASARHGSEPFVDRAIKRFLDDARECRVGLHRMQRDSESRVQIRDVARAIQIHRAGLDPRSFGFVHLQADPVLVFHPLSLGFRSEQARAASHARAASTFE